MGLLYLYLFEADKPLGARCTTYTIDNTKSFTEEIHKALTYSNNADPDMLLVLQYPLRKYMTEAIINSVQNEFVGRVAQSV